MKLVVVLITLLSFLYLVSGQNCADDCRIVCGNDLPSSVLTGPSTTLKRGKQGPKGQKGEVGLPGETGLPGEDGVDNSELVSNMEKRMDFFEKLVYKGLSTEIAKECGLGVQNRAIVADSQLTDGSHHYNREDHSARQGRLFGTTGAAAWVGGYSKRASGVIYDDNWIQADFLRNVFVEGVVTQGRENTDQRVTSYHLQYKENGQDQFKTIEDENNQPKIFEGNNDGSTPVIHKFKKEIHARVFRIQVVTWNSYPSMRFEFIKC